MKYHHDIQRLYNAINAVYFDDTVDAKIEWFRPRAPKGDCKQGMIYGYYDVRARTIRLNPCMNHAKVPQFFVNYVIFHECLHQLISPVLKPWKRDAVFESDVLDWHPQAFLEAEARFTHIKHAEAWEEKRRSWMMSRDCLDHPRKTRKRKAEAHDDD